MCICHSTHSISHPHTTSPQLHSPVPATFVAHGNSASPARDCASPPTPTTTSTPSSLTSTPSHSQLTPYKTSSTGGTDGSGTNCSGADLSEGITVGSVSLATGAIDENPIGCDTGMPRMPSLQVFCHVCGHCHTYTHIHVHTMYINTLYLIYTFLTHIYRTIVLSQSVWDRCMLLELVYTAVG